MQDSWLDDLKEKQAMKQQEEELQPRHPRNACSTALERALCPRRLTKSLKSDDRLQEFSKRIRAKILSLQEGQPQPRWP